MVKEERLKLKIPEICKLINISNYNNAITQIVTDIYNHERECRIGFSERKYRSYYTEVYNRSYCYIRIQRGTRTDGKEILWTLLHEYGHHIDKPLGIDEHLSFERKQERELAAWKYADIEFEKYSEFKNDIENYYENKVKCLLTYKLTIDDLNQYKINVSNPIDQKEG